MLAAWMAAMAGSSARRPTRGAPGRRANGPAVIRALVSIGTNSTRLLVLDGDRRIAAESRGTRIGAGIGETGAIDPAARDRTLAAIDDYVRQARELGATAADAIATSALRRASDGEAFGNEVAKRVGIAPSVLVGAEEATYSFLGATASHAGDGATASRAGEEQIAVLDVGGGSTELAVDSPARARANGEVQRAMSLEIGAVRLSERHPALLGAQALDENERRALEGEARADASAVLHPFTAVRGFTELIVVGGTAFTAAAMVANGAHDGATLTGADRRRLIDDLLARDLDARKAMPNIRPQRADILPAGLIVVDEACRALNIDTFTVSEADLLQGYLTSPAFRAVPLPPKR
ncbi:MAG: exopolyphosphatase / guanosine-5-triphosphate,3-diphosphate pyrophosphatase [Candidatus Eremiobacteraeota bacterium]|jgi:exopolyphosphatase/guanosine-5'-triphosphate,3'-diphosphate pyrophosphatase|nr:exopolyphosphatase / guanosine-5-triphosphate,3-diphosphate pyrophosphatase [Candidatus Eremiobacteraeota bacterium]